MQIETKLPKVGTTIFTVMSQLATEHKAVNLGQGFPDFDGPPALREALARAMNEGRNQYSPMTGVPALREAIARKTERLYGCKVNPDTEVTVTSGATEALFAAIAAVVRTGDEVIVLDPCYDSYLPNVELAGGVAVHVPLTPHGFQPDMAKIAAAITPRTRLLIINSPHNPSASVWSREDMLALQEVLAPTNVLLLSDEVYEHMVYDGAPHQSAARFAGLAERAFVVSSFGKTLHVTGWKIGSVCAPAALMAEFRKVHQFNVFSVNTPMQHGIAAYMASPASYQGLSRFYQAKRDLFRAGLGHTRLKLLPSSGSFFQCVDISAVSDLGDAEFCQWLTREIGVAAIPLSAFYADGFDQRVVRFCYAKQDETLHTALARLKKL